MGRMMGPRTEATISPVEAWPHRALAQRPTPLTFLERFSSWIGAEVWVKRDDLTGLGLSGNKVRKLEFHLGAALEAGCDAVVTCGGVQSNHCRATVLAARRLGLEPTVVLRGDPPDQTDGNLLLMRLAAARVRFCDATAYGDRGAPVLAEAADALRAAGRRPWVIPEGGSDAVGALGYVRAAEEVAAQSPAPFDAVVVAVGSGGTLAGLAAGPSIGPLVGVAVCDDRTTFEGIARRIGADTAARLARPFDPDRLRVVDDYVGPAYGVATEPVWALIRRMAATEGLLFDPVYTGKALHGLVEEVRAGRLGGRLLLWHTGGAFGLFGRGGEALPGGGA